MPSEKKEANIYKLRYRNDDAIEVGLDEAGRGCLFGRLYVGAVILTNDIEDMFDNGVALKEIRDSKLLTKRKRAILYDYVKECALDSTTAYVTSKEIDEENVLQADFTAMHRALDQLTIPIQRILVDGNYWRPYKGVEGYAIVDGDAQYLAIAAAGILAKVSRDRWVEEVVKEHPDWDEKYGLSSNMGYGTAKHMAGIKEHGITKEHRLSFAPVRAAKGSLTPKKNGWLGADSDSE
jgi:ribonuclease HII